MIIGRIEGATRVLGKGQGYLELPIRDELHETANGPGTPWMVTAWQPTPEELDKLNAGASVHVSIRGIRHLWSKSDPYHQSSNRSDRAIPPTSLDCCSALRPAAH